VRRAGGRPAIWRGAWISVGRGAPPATESRGSQCSPPAPGRTVARTRRWATVLRGIPHQVGVDATRATMTTPTNPPGRWLEIGTSRQGRTIRAFITHRRSQQTRLILGGMHGDEPKSVGLARRFIDHFASSPKHDPPIRWVVVPTVNPDGYERRNRRNAHRIDINRNFPTANWQRGRRHSRMFGGDAPASEPETQAVMALVRRYRPRLIVTIHSISQDRYCNNYDGPGRTYATRMAKCNGYPVTSTIGYPTPGSFGTWAGIEQGIPTITLELPSHHSPKRCWIDNHPALLSLA